MQSVFGMALGLMIAASLGIGSAWIAISQGQVFGRLSVGIWTAWPRGGGPDADPYALAALARSGELPLGAGEGVAFTAEHDTAGEPLVGRCIYALSGETPPARLWTLSAYDLAGKLIPNPARRSGFHSGEILRASDGSFAIAVSAEVAPGNWLPVSGTENFHLVLRLYDTPLTTGTQVGELSMPTIRKVGCR